MNKKINYIIATWSGKRISVRNMPEYYENVLKNHLKVLDNTPNSISRITIMKPQNDIQNAYYDIVLTDKMKLIECENKYQSYGQWLKAVELSMDEDFDYYIFIEDDYVPGTPDFDKKLLEMYEEGTYLCSKVELPDNTGHVHSHASVPYGIISKKTIDPLIRNKNYDEWLRKYGELYIEKVQHHENYQIAFSRYFQENNIDLKEYAHKYKVEFYGSTGLHDESRHNACNETLIAAIQSIVKDTKKEKINYVIATQNGSRIKTINSAYYENVLKNHLEILDNTPNSISRITIMKPQNDIQNSYYDINLTDKIKLIECENKYQSYGQWLKAVELSIDEDFDYYIFIDDDYVPGTPDFDKKLIEMYTRESYLCSLLNMPNNTGHIMCQTSVPYGIISKESIQHVIRRKNYEDWFKKYADLYIERVQYQKNYQLAFSRYLQDNNINLFDYSTKYRVEFYDSDGIHNKSRDGASFEAIFKAIQSVIKE